jgi:hypothetical protein
VIIVARRGEGLFGAYFQRKSVAVVATVSTVSICSLPLLALRFLFNIFYSNISNDN